MIYIQDVSPQVNENMEMELFSWGANSYGQLSTSHQNDILFPSKAVIAPTCRPKKIYGGGGHTLILSESGELWSCGWNSKGQLGLGHKENVGELQIIHDLKGKSVMKVACGWDFSLVLLNDHSLYGCGSNAFGQLGLPLDKSSISSFELLTSVGKAVDVAAGLRHSVILTADGDVMSFGNGKKGQLGHFEAKPAAKEPVPQKVLFPPGHGRVVQVIAGAYHTAALTECGEVIFWGCNKYGQGAQTAGDPIQHNSPLLIQKAIFDGNRVVKLFSGWTHFLALTDDKSVYSWGRADYGQLGRPVANNCDPKPSRIPGLLATQLCCGSEHNLAVTETSSIVSWGWNEHGICGSGDEENILKPEVISMFKDYDVLTIGCGGGHSFVLCRKR